MRGVLIRSLGLFWQRDEVDWSPGSGKRDAFRILGRVGKNSDKLRVVDFREQRGIYVLYDDYGPYYVGLARDRGIGRRLRSHTRDKHARHWDRFSWFGFRPVLKQKWPDGTTKLGAMPAKLLTDTSRTIGDVEALLIYAFGTGHRGNAQHMKFARGEHWEQVARQETEKYLDRIRR